MEEKIVYRRKNRLLGKNRVPAPLIRAPPCRKKGQNWGFKLNWKGGFLDLINDNPQLQDFFSSNFFDLVTKLVTSHLLKLVVTNS